MGEWTTLFRGSGQIVRNPYRWKERSGPSCWCSPSEGEGGRASRKERSGPAPGVTLSTSDEDVGVFVGKIALCTPSTGLGGGERVPLVGVATLGATTFGAPALGATYPNCPGPGGGERIFVRSSLLAAASTYGGSYNGRCGVLRSAKQWL